MSPYALVLRAPHVRALVLSSVIARVPLGILGLALVLFVEDETGSFAIAGAVTATFALSAAVLGVAMGRLIDVRGQTTVLLGGLAVHVVSLLTLVGLGLGGAPAWSLALCAIGAGAQPPVSSCLRPLWPGLLAGQPQLVPAAFALDALLIEVVFVTGPLLTGLLIALFSPQVAILAALAFIVTGTLAFASTAPSREWRGSARPAGGLAGALASPGLRTLTVGALGLGCGFGTLEVAFAAYGEGRGTAGLAGVLIALQATGSGIAGLWYGANAARLGSVRTIYPRLLLAVGPLIVLLAVAPTLGTIAAMALISGAAIAPLTTAQNLLVGELAPAGRVTESFTWIVTALIVGIAGGNAFAGAIVDVTSWRVAALGAAVPSAVAAGVTLLRRRTLAAQPL